MLPKLGKIRNFVRKKEACIPGTIVYTRTEEDHALNKELQVQSKKEQGKM